jgi:hypothetical protein
VQTLTILGVYLTYLLHCITLNFQRTKSV